MPSLNPLPGALGVRRAAHLLRRTSFRYTRARVDELAALTAPEAITLLLLVPAPLQLDQPVYNGAPWINPPQPPDTPLPADDELLSRYVMAWWVNEALHDPGAGHRLQFFLHQYLAVAADSGSSMEFFDYLALLRWGAFGNFKKLVMKIVVDNCMLRYIDNDQNFVSNPNENFAREYFELHTVGRGDVAGPGDYTTFTEDDVVQAARVLTGFNHGLRHLDADPETTIPAGKAYPQSHDFQPKTFSARFGGTVINAATNDVAGMQAELQAFVDMIFAQPETARNLCRRMYRFFLSRQITPEIETDIIQPLAQTLTDNGFELLPVLQQLLASEHFFDADDTDASDERVGAIIRSPLDLTLQTLSFFHITVPDAQANPVEHYETFYNSTVINRMFANAGLYLFFPPDVAGYPGYFQEPAFNRAFFNSATIVQRYKLPEMLLTGTVVFGPGSGDPIGTVVDLPVWLRDHSGIADAADPYIVVQELLTYVFAEAPSAERFQYFYETIFLDGLPPADWNYEWLQFLDTGDDTEVKLWLGRLFKAVLYSPEYQVY